MEVAHPYSLPLRNGSTTLKSSAGSYFVGRSAHPPLPPQEGLPPTNPGVVRSIEASFAAEQQGKEADGRDKVSLRSFFENFVRFEVNTRADVERARDALMDC